MTDRPAPRCPWCNGEMEYRSQDKLEIAPDKSHTYDLFRGRYQCVPCAVTSPYGRWELTEIAAQDAGYAAATQRYVEPNRVLTLEEASQKLEAIEPIYIEICRFGGGKWFSNGDDIIEAVSSRIKTPDIDEYYGTEWRAWLCRPTDAEREAVPWE